MLDGIGREFVQRQANGLSCTGVDLNFRPLDRNAETVDFNKWGEVAPDQIAQRSALPILLDKQIMGRGDTLQAIFKLCPEFRS